MSNPFETLSPRPTILQVVPALDLVGAERTPVDLCLFSTSDTADELTPV